MKEFLEENPPTEEMTDENEKTTPVITQAAMIKVSEVEKTDKRPSRIQRGTEERTIEDILSRGLPETQFPAIPDAANNRLIANLKDYFGETDSNRFAFTLHDIAALDFSHLAKINDASQENPTFERRASANLLAAKKILYECNISSSRKGFFYLCECFLVITEINQRFFSITKDLYPVVAKKFNTSSSVIESSIRSCITATWNSTKPTDAGIRRYFDEKPSNLKFILEICRIANFVHFGEK